MQCKFKWSLGENSLVVQWLEDSELSLPRVQVPPLVGELISPQAVQTNK